MGADLYIKTMDRKSQYRGYEVSKEAVAKGYFRDCYNDKGLFVHLTENTDQNLSWWALADNKKWFDKKGDLNELGQRALLSKVEGARKQLTDSEYIDWTDLLITFLNKALELKSPVIFSV